MDAPLPPVYDGPGRTGTMPRGAEPVSPPRSAHDPPNRFSDGLKSEKDSPNMTSLDSLDTRRELTVGDTTYSY